MAAILLYTVLLFAFTYIATQNSRKGVKKDTHDVKVGKTSNRRVGRLQRESEHHSSSRDAEREPVSGATANLANSTTHRGDLSKRALNYNGLSAQEISLMTGGGARLSRGTAAAAGNVVSLPSPSSRKNGDSRHTPRRGRRLSSGLSKLLFGGKKPHLTSAKHSQSVDETSRESVVTHCDDTTPNLPKLFRKKPHTFTFPKKHSQSVDESASAVTHGGETTSSLPKLFGKKPHTMFTKKHSQSVDESRSDVTTSERRPRLSMAEKLMEVGSAAPRTPQQSLKIARITRVLPRATTPKNRSNRTTRAPPRATTPRQSPKGEVARALAPVTFPRSTNKVMNYAHLYLKNNNISDSEPTSGSTSLSSTSSADDGSCKKARVSVTRQSARSEEGARVATPTSTNRMGRGKKVVNYTHLYLKKNNICDNEMITSTGSSSTSRSRQSPRNAATPRRIAKGVRGGHKAPLPSKKSSSYDDKDCEPSRSKSTSTSSVESSTSASSLSSASISASYACASYASASSATDSRSAPPSPLSQVGDADRWQAVGSSDTRGGNSVRGKNFVKPLLAWLQHSPKSSSSTSGASGGGSGTGSGHVGVTNVSSSDRDTTFVFTNSVRNVLSPTLSPTQVPPTLKMLRAQRSRSEMVYRSHTNQRVRELYSLENKKRSVSSIGSAGEISNPPPPCKPPPTQRERTLNEIVQTEHRFVSQLVYVMETCTKRLVEEIEKNSSFRKLPNMGHLMALFDLLKPLRDLNLRFVHVIQEALATNERTIAEVFLEFAPFFKMYGQYSAVYEKATDLIEALNNSHKRHFREFNEIVRRAFDDPKAGGLDFESFLIQPVQRLPRYSLLLRDLQKHTPEAHPDHNTIEKALVIIESVNSSINQEIFVNRQRELLIEVCEQFTTDPMFIAPTRNFVSQAELNKLNNETLRWDRLCFFLFNDMVACATINRRGKKYTFASRLTFNKQATVDIADSQTGNVFCFQVSGSEGSWVLSAQTEHLKLEWMRLIDQCVAS